MTTDDRPISPAHQPEDAVDDLERHVLGATQDQVREGAPDDGGPGTTPAFDTDLDPEEQGAAPSSSEHPE